MEELKTGARCKAEIQASSAAMEHNNIHGYVSGVQVISATILDVTYVGYASVAETNAFVMTSPTTTRIDTTTLIPLFLFHNEKVEMPF